MTSRVYLSGPIEGLTYTEATTWRDQVGGLLHRSGVIVHDPMRGRVYRDPDARVTVHRPLHEVVVSVDPSMDTDRGITIRDHRDTVHSDLLFVNLLYATKVSIGTVIEVAWAWDRRIPVLAVMEPHFNPHEHPMFREMISYRVPDVMSGIRVTLSVLNMGEAI